MALINCHECNGSVSDSAVACPHCGAPIRSQPADPSPQAKTPKDDSGDVITGIVTFLLFAGLIYWWFFSGDDEDETESRPVAQENRQVAPDIDSATQARVKKLIEGAGMWCGRAVRYYEAPFKSSVNRPVYYAFCDDGINAVIYYIHMDRSGRVLSIEEG